MTNIDRLGAKGEELEEILRTYFSQAGYFSVRGVPYRLDSEEVTDVDLWLYERPAALTRRRIIVDVKNKKTPKAAERIIWVSGLQRALQVDGSIVATTDNRVASETLSQKLGVTLLNGDAVAKLRTSERLKSADQIGQDAILHSLGKFDKARSTAVCRDTHFRAKAALISDFGTSSCNANLYAFGVFAKLATEVHPDSDFAETLLRLTYIHASYVAISLDFMVSKHAFQSQEDRKRLLVRGIRLGGQNAPGQLGIIDLAINLARRYADNGSVVAKQIEGGIQREIAEIPADIVAEYVTKLAAGSALFDVAKEMDRVSRLASLTSFDKLGVEAKSLVGVLLDYAGLSRAAVAKCWSGNGKSVSDINGPGPLKSDPPAKKMSRETSRPDDLVGQTGSGKLGPLFDE